MSNDIQLTTAFACPPVEEKSFWTNFTLSLNIDLPAIMLFIISGLGIYIMIAAQRQGDFNFSEMLRDESNKPSAVRIGVLVSLAVSSWIVMQHALLAGASLNPQVVGLYIFAWSGALVFVKAAEKWNGTLPFGPK